MFRARYNWFRLPDRFKLVQSWSFCTNKSNTNKPTVNNDITSAKVESNLSNYWETYGKLDKLDFMSAAKIAFSEPSKKKKFGIDFHLVQLFFVCMPPLAVYLVAQYARYEMRKMDAELEQKKKQEEEKEKEKEKARIEFVAAKDKEAGTDPELLKVKERLDKLEEAVKEIAVVSKEQLCCSPTKNQENGSVEEKHFTSTQPSNSNSGSESTKAVKKEDSLKLTPNIGKESTVSRSEPTSNASFNDQKGKTRDGGGATQNGRT